MPRLDSDVAALKRLARKSQSDFTTEAENLLWISGPHSLAILNVVTMEKTDLPGFWRSPETGTDALALVAIASHKFMKAAGIGLTSGGQSIHVWDASKQPLCRRSAMAASLLKSKPS